MPQQDSSDLQDQEVSWDDGTITRDHACHSLFEYIDLCYNRVRSHAALGYESLSQFDEALYPFPAPAIPG